MVRLGFLLAVAMALGGCGGDIRGTYLSRSEAIVIEKEGGQAFVKTTSFGKMAEKIYRLEKADTGYVFHVDPFTRIDVVKTETGLRLLSDGRQHDYTRVDPKEARNSPGADELGQLLARELGAAGAALAKERVCEPPQFLTSGWRLETTKARHLGTLVSGLRLEVRSVTPETKPFFVEVQAEGVMVFPDSRTPVDDAPVCLAKKLRIFPTSEADRYECTSWGKKAVTVTTVASILPFKVRVVLDRFPRVQGDSARFEWDDRGGTENSTKLLCKLMGRKELAFATAP